MQCGASVDYEIIWRPEARDDLFTIYDWLADRADPETAIAYTSRIESFLQRLRIFPNRGTPRFDVSSGLRTVTFERRVIIAYRVENRMVHVVRLIDSGRDFSKTFDHG
jgi:toxin ParE1/3/4